MDLPILANIRDKFNLLLIAEQLLELDVKMA